jgi:hypothetical protein
VIANLLMRSLYLMSYRHMCFELPPPITNSPFGLIAIELKCLFLDEFFALNLSSLNLPPYISSLQSMIPRSAESDAYHIYIYPPKVVATISLLLGWKSTERTSEA